MKLILLLIFVFSPAAFALQCPNFTGIYKSVGGEIVEYRGIIQTSATLKIYGAQDFVAILDGQDHSARLPDESFGAYRISCGVDFLTITFDGKKADGTQINIISQLKQTSLGFDLIVTGSERGSSRWQKLQL